MIQFSTLHPDGTETNVREIDQSVFLACPFTIMLPEHYDNPPPGKPCRCYDPVYRKDVMIGKEKWGYTKKDFARKGIK